MYDRVVFVILTMLAAATARADSTTQVQTGAATAPVADEFQETAAGHGSISLVYTNYFENGIWATPHKKVPYGTVHDHGVGFEGSYNIANNWSIYGGMRYTDNVAHPIGAPEHTINAWQDITLGTAWRRRFDNYDFTASAGANIPSHDYPVSGGDYTGQRLRQLLLAATLSHQFDFSNFYYKVGYGYAFSQKVLGVDTGYQRFDAELGWFVKERFALRGFLTGRGGFGLTSAETNRLVAAGNKAFALNRARVAEHSYRAWGFGFDYDFGNRYIASVSAQHLFWGATVFNIDYAIEARLTRNF